VIEFRVFMMPYLNFYIIASLRILYGSTRVRPYEMDFYSEYTRLETLHVPTSPNKTQADWTRARCRLIEESLIAAKRMFRDDAILYDPGSMPRLKCEKAHEQQ